MGAFVIGLDLGQSQDFSALSVLEYSGFASRRYACHHLERVPLGTDYISVVNRVKTVKGSKGLEGAALVVDASGPGRPVVDMLRASGLALFAVTIVSGRTVRRKGEMIHVPKSQLIAPLVSVFENGRFTFLPGIAQAAAMAQELSSFKRTITKAKNVTYSAKSGAHDDLIISIALGVWFGESTAGRDKT